MTNEELFNKYFKDRDRVLKRIEELKAQMIVEKDDFKINEIYFLLNTYYRSELEDLNRCIISILEPYKLKAPKKSRIFNLGIGQR